MGLIKDFSTDAKQAVYDATFTSGGVEFEIEVDLLMQEGWFEFYDEDTGGQETHAEGVIELNGNKVIGYDGVAQLNKEITTQLVRWGFDLSEL